LTREFSKTGVLFSQFLSFFRTVDKIVNRYVSLNLPYPMCCKRREFCRHITDRINFICTCVQNGIGCILLLFPFFG